MIPESVGSPLQVHSLLVSLMARAFYSYYITYNSIFREDLKREYNLLKKDLQSKRKELSKVAVQEKPEPQDKFAAAEAEHNAEIETYKAKQSSLPKKGNFVPT